MEHFSEREEKIIKIIGYRSSSTIECISKRLFKKTTILDPDIAVANSIRRIIKKCEHHKLKWTLEKERVNKQLFIRRSKV